MVLNCQKYKKNHQKLKISNYKSLFKYSKLKEDVIPHRMDSLHFCFAKVLKFKFIGRSPFSGWWRA